MKRCYFLSWLTLFFLLVPAMIYAQNELSGVIKDAGSGMVLPGAYIYLPDIKRRAVSDKNGFYSIKNIPSGFFLTEISIIGYAPQTGELLIKGITQKKLFTQPF